MKKYYNNDDRKIVEYSFNTPGKTSWSRGSKLIILLLILALAFIAVGIIKGKIDRHREEQLEQEYRQAFNIPDDEVVETTDYIEPLKWIECYVTESEDVFSLVEESCSSEYSTDRYGNEHAYCICFLDTEEPDEHVTYLGGMYKNLVIDLTITAGYDNFKGVGWLEVINGDTGETLYTSPKFPEVLDVTQTVDVTGVDKLIVVRHFEDYTPMDWDGSIYVCVKDFTFYPEEGAEW